MVTHDSLVANSKTSLILGPNPEHCKHEKRIRLNRTLEIGLALCDVFHYLYTQRFPIIFRDIKPANIMLTRAGRICLIDFGIARLYRPGWKDTSPLGTVGYAAPEQYGRGAHTTPQSDIYGLGATLQTLLTGKEPLEILQDGIPSITSILLLVYPLWTCPITRLSTWWRWE